MVHHSPAKWKCCPRSQDIIKSDISCSICRQIFLFIQGRLCNTIFSNIYCKYVVTYLLRSHFFGAVFFSFGEGPSPANIHHRCTVASCIQLHYHFACFHLQLHQVSNDMLHVNTMSLSSVLRFQSLHSNFVWFPRHSRTLYCSISHVPQFAAIYN